MTQRLLCWPEAAAWSVSLDCQCSVEMHVAQLWDMKSHDTVKSPDQFQGL